jgi:hypothetical protein
MSLTSKQETAAPLAHLYLRNSTPFYFSHEFIDVYVDTIIKEVSSNTNPNEIVDISLQLDQQTQDLHYCSYYTDYLYRPQSLEYISLWSYLSEYVITKSDIGESLLSGHPKSGTHTLQRRKFTKIIVPVGKRLPRLKDIELEDYDYFFKYILIFFKPFRTLADLVPQDWQHGFEYFDQTLQAKHFIYLNQDYYESNNKTNDRKDDDLEYYDSLKSDMKTTNDMYDNDDDTNSTDWEDISFEPVEFEMKINMLPEDNAHIDRLVTASKPPMHQHFEKYNASAVEEPESIQNHNTIHECNDEAIKLFIGAMDETLFTGKAENILHDYPTILQTSGFFHLNKRQHQMFTKHALHLLYIWASDTSIPADKLRPILQKEQIISHLVGPAGFGKSKVITALLMFADKWQRADSVVTTSFFGVAAQNAGGVHLHSLCSWPLHSEHKIPDETVLKRLRRIRLLIVDEISAVPQRLMGCLCSLLNVVHKKNDTAGGIDMMLVGDWLQMPPVGGNTIFTKTRKSVHSQIALKLWESINYVVYLEEDMRHRSNPIWVEILKRLRLGINRLTH